MFVTLELLFPTAKLRSISVYSHPQFESEVYRLNSALQDLFDFRKHPEFAELCRDVVTDGLQQIKPLFDYFTENFPLHPYNIGYFSCLLISLKELRSVYNWTNHIMRLKDTHQAGPALVALTRARNILNTHWID